MGLQLVYLPSPLPLPPIIDYIAAMKHICDSLGEDNLPSKLTVWSITPKSKMYLPIIATDLKAPKSDITKEERKILHNLKKDNNCMILATDKSVALVVMDRDIYIEKCVTLLSDQNLYQECKDFQSVRDFPKSVHNKVIRQLSDLKH